MILPNFYTAWRFLLQQKAERKAEEEVEALEDLAWRNHEELRLDGDAFMGEVESLRRKRAEGELEEAALRCGELGGDTGNSVN